MAKIKFNKKILNELESNSKIDSELIKLYERQKQLQKSKDDKNKQAIKMLVDTVVNNINLEYYIKSFKEKELDVAKLETYISDIINEFQEKLELISGVYGISTLNKSKEETEEPQNN